VETCDDGNGVDADACSDTCETSCGDGVVDPGESCDPPGTPAGASGATCRGNCTVCGDGHVDSGEQCDDADAVDGDGCDSDCTLSETLLPPSIPLADGTRLIGAGVGTYTQPGAIALDVPAGARVEQVLLYWNGFHTTPTGDDDVLVDGKTVTGELIAGPTLFFGVTRSSTWRADITDLGLVADGPSSQELTIDGFDLDPGVGLGRTNGVSVIVILDDGTTGEIALRDGQDLAFRDFTPPLNATVPQTFDFTPAGTSRMAELTILVGSVAVDRPNIVRVTVGGAMTDLLDPLASSNGEQWDHVVIPVEIPAGAGELTVELLSDAHGSVFLPASMAWVVAGLDVPEP